MRLTIDSVNVASSIGIYTAPERHRFLILYVTAKALADKQSVNPFYFKVEDEEGAVGTYSIATYALPEPLHDAPLDREQKAVGQIAFEIRLQAHELKLHFEPWFLNYKLKVCFTAP